jgi:hypothetical protein
MNNLNAQGEFGADIFGHNAEYRLTDQFDNSVNSGNFRDAYDSFRQCPQAILTYYLQNGGQATRQVLEQTRTQVGWFAALRLNLTLDILLARREKAFAQLKKDFKLYREQARKDTTVSSETMHLTFDY